MSVPAATPSSPAATDSLPPFVAASNNKGKSSKKADGRPGEVSTLEDMERLRRRHAEELKSVLMEEMTKEKIRVSVLASERSKKRRAAIEVSFDKERAHVRTRLWQRCAAPHIDVECLYPISRGMMDVEGPI